MVALFGRDQSVIFRHINNALEEGETHTKSNMQKMHIASADRPVTYYDLETVISVGYRIKSPQGVAFRRWATARLKDYRLKGYALNQQRLQQNDAELEQALRLIQKPAASPDLTVESGRGLMDIISRYTHTFLWLQQYDAGLLQEPSGESGASCPACKKRAPRCIPSNNNSSRAARRLNFSPVSGKTVSPPRLVTSNKAFSAPPPSH